jgi:hypothetical protein
MARTLKAVPDGDEYPAEQGTIGSIPNEPGNGLPSHDEIRMAANEMVAWNEKRAALNAQISGFRKGCKAMGITLGALDKQVRMLAWTPEEVKKDYEENQWYAEAMRHPIGSQLELYGTDATPDGVKEQLKWRNIGFKDGVAGRGWANEAPKECPATSVQSYGEGHEEGQATVRRAFEVRLTATNAAGAEAAPDDDQIDIEDVANDTAAQQDAA